MKRIAHGVFEGLPLTPAIETEHYVFVTGQVGSGPDGSYPADIAEQTRVTLDKLGALLELAGSSYAKVVKTTVFMTEIREFAAMNEVYRGYFPSAPAARSTIGVSALVDLGCRIEIEAIALK
ncbi:MAG: RidA family protein [Devosia sp.]